MNIRTGFAAGFFVLLAACGGGGGGGGMESATPAAVKTPKSVVISDIGDSTMAGLELVNGQYVETGLPHKDLQADLQAKFDATVTVEGPYISGGTIQNVIEGTAYLPPYTQYLASTKAAIVIADFGINDGKFNTVDQFGQYLVDFISQTQQAGRIPVLEEPVPPCNPAGGNLYSAPGVLYQSPFVNKIDQVGASYGVTVITQYDALQADPSYCAVVTDGTHPSDAGYALRAQREADQLAPIVASLR